ncbi:ferritin-like domain-containing protein [Dermatobacter hominis]|uniref:ferritin-like domain-containing protein n=1 Tax=Dermatobacter hominis TaxID=2884263 RepID=UPI001D10EADE|nr:ferritin-like domain-containing protein [Dermatobacter hominis]UDY34262.1 ferritin-like domain-containing protein [Dermatobacter hominis]
MTTFETEPTADPYVVRDPALVDAIVHELDLHSDVLFTWDYERSRTALVKLYEKAKTSQWNGNDLPWHLEVDQEKVAADSAAQNERFNVMQTDPESPLRSWGEKEWLKASAEIQTAMLSQFLHGEQGALICTGLITATVPWIDAKYYAATQVMDEARHVEVFARYLQEKTNGMYPINPNLGSLLDDIIVDGRWDITYLGMQIMVEGLALAAFGFMHMLTTEPLLKQLLRYVMSDEARHVAFGVLSLKEFYEGLDAAEIRERQEFAFEAAVRLQQRFMFHDVWERLGADPKAVHEFMLSRPNPGQEMFQSILFSKIVPNAKKLGLLDAGDGWLRTKFTEIGIIQYEDWVDTTDEYASLDAVAPPGA